MFDVKLQNKEKHQESKTYKPGKKLVAVNLPWGKLGLTICFDLRFPEIYRNLSKRKFTFYKCSICIYKNYRKKTLVRLVKS